MSARPRHHWFLPLACCLAACGSELSGEPNAADVAPEVEVDVAPEVEPEVEPDGLEDVVPEADVAPETDLAVEVDTAPEVADEVDEVTPDVAPSACADLADGEPCDDGDACTTGERCVAGVCLPTAPLDCDDDNVCSDDTCSPEVGCVHLANLATCDDGDPCTTGDRCSVGICRPGGATCDDDNPCTRDSCAPDGRCSNVADDDLLCEDASACTAGDFCRGGVCISGLGDGCAESDPCVAVACGDDGLTCELEMLNGIGCDDGDACTTNDTCQGGLCRAGPAIECPWDTECAAFRCERTTGCVLDTTYQEGKACSDDDRCTLGEKCDGGGVCAPLEPAPCDDNNPCTTDSCDANWGCEYSWVQGPCDDKSACTLNDACEFGQCRGAAVPCDDQDACTTDSCDPLLGCQRLPTICDDGNACTIDSCDRASGCRFTPRSGACDDGLVCTLADSCVAGVCRPGPVACDDDDPCTADVCDAEEGCLNVPIAPCPVGALTVSAVGVNASASGLGQWVAITNASAASFDLDGYAIRGEACDCEVVIDESVIATGTIYGLRASSPAPSAGEIAPGGPTTSSAFDFELGVPGDGFFIDRTGDRIELVGPAGELVDALVVP